MIIETTKCIMGKITRDPPEYYGLEFNRPTNIYENITFPQTTYVGGNNVEIEDLIYVKLVADFSTEFKWPKK